MRVVVRLFALTLCAAAAASAGAATKLQAQSSAGARPASSLPNPAGLRPVFPAGVSSGSGAAQSTDPIAQSSAPVPASSVGTNTTSTTGGTVFVPQVLPSGVVSEAGVATNVMGAGGSVPGPTQYLNSGAAGVSAADEARSFFFADANHDGELSPAEFRRLSIVTQSFEQMDRNFDGVISRFEYQDSLR